MNSDFKYEIKVYAAAVLTILIYSAIVHPAAADVTGTLMAVTDWMVLAIRAAAAIFIIVFLLSAANGRASVGGGVLCIGCIAAAIQARELAAMIQ